MADKCTCCGEFHQPGATSNTLLSQSAEIARLKAERDNLTTALKIKDDFLAELRKDFAGRIAELERQLAQARAETWENAAKIADDLYSKISEPFQPGMFGGDTIPIVMRQHLAKQIRAAAEKEKGKNDATPDDL